MDATLHQISAELGMTHSLNGLQRVLKVITFMALSCWLQLLLCVAVAFAQLDEGANGDSDVKQTPYPRMSEVELTEGSGEFARTENKQQHRSQTKYPMVPPAYPVAWERPPVGASQIRRAFIGVPVPVPTKVPWYVPVPRAVGIAVNIPIIHHVPIKYYVPIPVPRYVTIPHQIDIPVYHHYKIATPVSVPYFREVGIPQPVKVPVPVPRPMDVQVVHKRNQPVDIPIYHHFVNQQPYTIEAPPCVQPYC